METQEERFVCIGNPEIAKISADSNGYSVFIKKQITRKKTGEVYLGYSVTADGYSSTFEGCINVILKRIIHYSVRDGVVQSLQDVIDIIEHTKKTIMDALRIDGAIEEIVKLK